MAPRPTRTKTRPESAEEVEEDQSAETNGAAKRKMPKYGAVSVAGIPDRRRRESGRKRQYVNLLTGVSEGSIDLRALEVDPETGERPWTRIVAFPTYSGATIAKNHCTGWEGREPKLDENGEQVVDGKGKPVFEKVWHDPDRELPPGKWSFETRTVTPADVTDYPEVYGGIEEFDSQGKASVLFARYDG